MGNGQWAMGNGQWAMGNGQWAMGNGQISLAAQIQLLISNSANYSPLTKKRRMHHLIHPPGRLVLDIEGINPFLTHRV
jgi:hypothetical protein